MDYLHKVLAVRLNNAQISDVTPLAGLKNLERLDLTGTPVSDLTPLTGLTNLNWLWLDETHVSEEQVEELQQALPNCDIGRAPAQILSP